MLIVYDQSTRPLIKGKDITKPKEGTQDSSIEECTFMAERVIDNQKLKDESYKKFIDGLTDTRAIDGITDTRATNRSGQFYVGAINTDNSFLVNRCYHLNREYVEKLESITSGIQSTEDKKYEEIQGDNAETESLEVGWQRVYMHADNWLKTGKEINLC